MVLQDTAVAQERRRRTRYPIQLALRFVVVPAQDRPSRSGDGRSVDLSSVGMHFRSAARLEPGDSVIAALDWPASAPDTPLVLLLSGHIVWKNGPDIGMSVSRHDLVSATAPIAGLQQLTGYLLPRQPVPPNRPSSR